MYCDTNILSKIVDNPENWPAFHKYLSETQALLVVSLIQIVEFKKVPHYHQGLSKLLLSTPSAIFKWWKNILREETKLYPTTEGLDPIVRPILTDLLHGASGQIELETLLGADDIELIWQTVDSSKEPYMKVISWLPSTAPNNKTFMDMDFKLHNYGVVADEIREVNQDLINALKGQADKFKPELFRGSYTRAAYSYYRYILKGLTPEPSDIGDIHHVFYAPYSDEMITEKSMASILHQLRKEKGLLPKTQIREIRFLRDLLSS